MYTVLYFDDEIYPQKPSRGALRYKGLLERESHLKVEVQLPPRDLSDLPVNIPDGLLIDFDLRAADSMEGTSPVAYFGSTLASELRMRHPDTPIILITRPGVIVTEKWMQQILKRSIDFDLILEKDKIDLDPESLANRIIDLIKGHQTLRDVVRPDWEQLVLLLGANDIEEHYLREASPPLEGGQWYTASISRWLRNVVLKYPGIVYDELHASVRLGISLEAFHHDDVQEYLRTTQYTGIFATSHRIWWRDRLLHQAQTLISKHEIDGSILDSFRQAFYQETGISLQPSVCVSDGTSPADWVCHLYNQPVKSENSIPYYPDNRPSVMDQARVSTKAIKEHSDFDQALVDAESHKLVRELWGLNDNES